MIEREWVSIVGKQVWGLGGFGSAARRVLAAIEWSNVLIKTVGWSTSILGGLVYHPTDIAEW